MANLPKVRLGFGYRPCTNTGLIYFGPFYVSVKHSTEKRFGFLYTCLNVRAVHFEVVQSMNTSSCVLRIEKLVSEPGVLLVIWSDNGMKFIASGMDFLNNILDYNQQVLTRTLFKKCIKWKFNSSSAPCHGDVWERLGGTFKHFFHANIGNRTQTNQTLTTTFCLVEKNLNARTLVPPRPMRLTWMSWIEYHSLLGAAYSSWPSNLSTNFDHTKLNARVPAYSDAMWSPWLREYALNLNRCSKWLSSAEGDLRPLI